MLLDTTIGWGIDDAAAREQLADLLAVASDMVPRLKERGAESDALRRLPDATIDEMVSAGFLRVGQPPRFGGLGLSLDAVCELTMEVGRGCGATAWLTSFYLGHNVCIGLFSEAAQLEYWSNSEDVFSSTASAIVSMEYEAVEGGLQVSCHLKFSSGCDLAEWIMVFTPLGVGLVPRSDYRIVDDWYTLGLRGSGSKAIVLENVFIPEHRFVSWEQLRTGRAPGSALYPENPYYRAPFTIMANTMLVAPVLGIARGLIEVFGERALHRSDNHTGKKAFERPGTQLRFGEATAEVETAILVLGQIFHDLRTCATVEEPMPVFERARVRRNVAYSARLCLQAGDRLLEAGDAGGQYDGQLVQRLGRDLHMAGLQASLTWDEPAMSYAQAYWGLEPESWQT